jgi:hypothetical protein
MRRRELILFVGGADDRDSRSPRAAAELNTSDKFAQLYPIKGLRLA